MALSRRHPASSSLVVLLGLALSTAHGQSQVGYFGSNWKAREFSDPASTTSASFEASGVPNAVVTVSLGDTIAKVLPTQFGVNTTFRTGSSVLDRVPLYTQAKFGTFRWPAGSGSNAYFWDGNIPGDLVLDGTKIQPIDGPRSADLNPTAFAKFLDSSRTQANVVVNYFYARYGRTPEDSRVGATASSKRSARVDQAARYAAGLVRKMNIELKAKIVNWEIGNECYGNWEQGFQVNGVAVTGKEYGEDFRVFAAAMKAVDPTIKVGAVVGWNTAWTSGVLPEVKDAADFLVLHEYPVSEKNSSAQAVFGTIGVYKEIADTLNAQVVRYTGKPKGHYPITLTEYNSRGYPTTNMINGLYLSQVIGELIKNKYGLASIWVGEWGGGEDTYNHGLISTNDPGQPAYSPRPSYMPFYYYGKYFGDHMLASSSTSSGIRSYASVFSNSRIGLVLTNTTGNDQLVQIKLNSPGFNRAYWHTMHATDLDSGNKKFYVNGQTGTTVGGGPVNFVGIPAYAATFADNAILKVKKYSATYLALGPKPVSVSQGANSRRRASWSLAGPSAIRVTDLASPIRRATWISLDGKRQDAEAAGIPEDEGAITIPLPRNLDGVHILHLELGNGSHTSQVIPLVSKP